MKLFNEGPIINYLKEPILNDHLELEVIFGSNVGDNPLDKKTFMRVLEQCKVYYPTLSETTTLDIRQEYKGNPSNIRATIHGLESIKKYCREENLSELQNIEYLQKIRYSDNKGNHFPTLRDEDYNVRLNLKKEVPLHDRHYYVQSFLKSFDEKKKHYRYKKRFSFETNDRLFRIDLSVIKATEYKRGGYNFAKSFKESNILNNKELYELEIEYIGQGSKVGDTKLRKLYEIIQENLTLTEPGYQGIGNEYDPLNLGIGVPSDLEDTDVNYTYEFDSPRYSGHSSVSYTENSVQYTENEYRTLLGKFVRIKDSYFKDKQINEKVKQALNEYYLKGIHIGIVNDIQENFDEDGEYVNTTLDIGLSPSIGGYSQLVVPLNDVYDGNFTVGPDTIEEGRDEYVGIDFEITKKKEPIKKSFDRESSLNELSNELLNLLETHVIYLSKIIYNTENLMSYKNKKEIIKRYKTLTGQTTPYFTFIGPQPVTLTMDDIKINSGKSIITNYAVTEKADGERYQMFITKNNGYLINSKMNVIDMNIYLHEIEGEWILDGEYITTDQYGESMNLFMVFDVYWASTQGISKDKQIHDYPFLSTIPGQTSRLSVMKEFFSIIQRENGILYLREQERPIEILMKEYLFGYIEDDFDPQPADPTKEQRKDIFKASKKILQRSKQNHYPYRIDGLIYLPVKFSVKGSIQGIRKKRIHGTWNHNYKWKPPDENSIDFKVRVVKDVFKSKVRDRVIPFTKKGPGGINVVNEYKQLELLVGYRAIEDETINFCMEVLHDTIDKNENNLQLFNIHSKEDEKYNTTHVQLQEGKMKCLDGSEIMDGDHVEMRFIPDAENGMHWEPMRLRNDKKKPQFFGVANKVWSTIQNPVSQEIICGDYKVKKGENPYQSEIGKYYVDEDNDSLYESNKLRKLHNYIKSKLIGGICSARPTKQIQVLDLSCGRGGDNRKYINKDTKVTFLLGLDISSNIHEACKRYYDEGNRIKGAFLRADTSKNIQNGECAMIEGGDQEDRNHCETMVNILYKNMKPIPKEYKKINTKYSGLASNGFDVVSSQFSIHYYFETEKKFLGFLENLKQNVKSGGYFIGTCYDGMKIFEHFKTNIEKRKAWKDENEPETETETESETESESGSMELNIPHYTDEYKEFSYVDLNGNKVFSVEKEYELESFEYDPENTKNIFGNQINVYMDSIGQVIPEYLVNMDYLKDIMKQNGFEITVPTNIMPRYANLFRKDYFEDDLGQFSKVIDKLSEINSSDRQFRDFYGEALEMKRDISYYDKKNKKVQEYPNVNRNPLIELSSFNNYFIFKKI